QQFQGAGRSERLSWGCGGHLRELAWQETAAPGWREKPDAALCGVPCAVLFAADVRRRILPRRKAAEHLFVTGAAGRAARDLVALSPAGPGHESPADRRVRLFRVQGGIRTIGIAVLFSVVRRVSADAAGPHRPWRDVA